MIENLSVGEHFRTSDHQITRWNMLAYKVIQKQIKSYNYNKGDYDKIRDEEVPLIEMKLLLEIM